MKAARANRHSKYNMTPTVETRTNACITLWVMVSVTTRLMLVTSLLSRLITSPVLAAVKKRRESPWR